MMEAGMIMQVLIVGIYWPFIHESMMNRLKPLPDFHIHYWNALFKHSYPAVAMIANIWLSRVAFIRGHYIYCIRIGIVYAIFNYWGTLSRGHPLYPFLTWESVPLGIAICAAIIGIATGMYLGLTNIVNKNKFKLEDKKK
jgi:hypothetical protein